MTRKVLAQKLERLADLVDKQGRLYDLQEKTGQRSSSDPVTYEAHRLNEETRDHGREISKVCRELASQVQDPVETLIEVAWSYTSSAALAVALDLNVFHHIDPGETGTPIEELAKNCGASDGLLKRVMRLCAHKSISEEIASGRYRHTRASRALLNEGTSALVQFLVEDGLRCAAYLSETVRENDFQILENRHRASFCRAFATTSDFYEYYALVDKERGAKFDRAMAGFYDGIWDRPQEVIFPFHDLPSGAKIVDVGGGRGQNSFRLGMRYPQLSFVVQDLEIVIEAAKRDANVPPSMFNRLQWQTHNFFDAQSVIGADVYLLSHVLMDHFDSDCKQILQRLADAMTTSNSRILIHDYVDGEKLVSQRSELADMLEIHGIACQNTRFRSIAEWKSLLDESRKGLVLRNVWEYEGGAALMEVKLEEPRSHN